MRAPLDPLKAADYAGALEGWRLWIVRRHDVRYIDAATGLKRRKRGPYLLKSVTSTDFWRPRIPLVADCNQTPGYLFELTHDDDDLASPDSACKCGIYAVRSLHKLMEMYDDSNRFLFRMDMERHAAVVGTVRLWGKVIPGEWGWRAQYAYPSKLFIVETLVGSLRNRHARVREDLGNYNVPIEYMSLSELLGYTSLLRRKVEAVPDV